MLIAPYAFCKSVRKCLRSFHSTNLILLRIWWNTYSWMIVPGKADLIAYCIPLRLSVLAIRISFIPLALISVITLSRKLALPVSLIQMPGNLFQARVPEPDSRLQPVEVPNQLPTHLHRIICTILLHPCWRPEYLMSF